VNWQREHNEKAAERLAAAQKHTLGLAKAIGVLFVVGRDPVPRYLLDKQRYRVSRRRERSRAW
jgi:hypothetical protein